MKEVNDFDPIEGVVYPTIADILRYVYSCRFCAYFSPLHRLGVDDWLDACGLCVRFPPQVTWDDEERAQVRGGHACGEFRPAASLLERLRDAIEAGAPRG